MLGTPLHITLNKLFGVLVPLRELEPFPWPCWNVTWIWCPQRISYYVCQFKRPGQIYLTLCITMLWVQLIISNPWFLHLCIWSYYWCNYDFKNVAWSGRFIPISIILHPRHHKLAPSLYECFYNTLTICSTFNVDTIIDMMLRWHCNNMSWNDIDITLKHLTSYQY
jgi:hypothetical protein